MLLKFGLNGHKVENLENDYTQVLSNVKCKIWSKGYCFDDRGNLYLDKEISLTIPDFCNYRYFLNTVKTIDGAFSIIVIPECNDDDVIICTDRYGTIPIYYFMDGSDLIISNNFIDIVKEIDCVHLDIDAIREMAISGYITGTNTIAYSIKEIANASIYRFNNLETTEMRKIKREKYWVLRFTNENRKSEKDLMLDFALIMRSVLRKYAGAINNKNWKTGITLSGGLDSRVLLSGLLKEGINNIVSISYGNKKDPDVLIAKKVSDALKVEHLFAEISDINYLCKNYLDDIIPITGETTRFTCGVGIQIGTSKFGNKIDCIIPGHSFDLTTGSWLRPDIFSVSNKYEAIKYYFYRNFTTISSSMMKMLFGEKAIDDQMNKFYETYDYEVDDPIGSIERWNYENRQRRLILRELRSYERIGRWFLPYYDRNLMDYLAKIPLKYKYRQMLYINTVLEYQFIDSLKVLASIPLDRGVLSRVDNNKDIIGRALFSSSNIKQVQVVSFLYKLLRGIKYHTNKYKYNVNGPDPLDYWWYKDVNIKNKIISWLNEDDILSSIIRCDILNKLLKERKIPSSFIRVAIPSMLTIIFAKKWITRIKHDVG